MNITQMANELGRDRKTIRKWLDQDPPEKYQRKVTRQGKLDPYPLYVRIVVV